MSKNWLQYLIEQHPFTGRFIKENGDRTNVADIISERGGMPVKFGQRSMFDAFGRLRTSNPETVFDSDMIVVFATSASGTANCSSHLIWIETE